jgi:hypothetical protein
LGTESIRPSPKQSKIKAKPRHRAVLAFPVTRSQTEAEPSHTEDRENDDRDSDEEEQEKAGEEQEETGEEQGSEDEEPTSRQEETQNAYKKLSLHFLEKLKKACAQYGPIWPYCALYVGLTRKPKYTMAYPNDWKFLAQATLSAGD